MHRVNAQIPHVGFSGDERRINAKGIDQRIPYHPGQVHCGVVLGHNFPFSNCKLLPDHSIGFTMN
jgi:hypothetical protein